MTSATLMKSSLNSHYIGNKKYFYSIDLQNATTEARQGHQILADEVKCLVNNAKNNFLKKHTIHLNRSSVSYLQRRLSDIIMTNFLRKTIDCIVLEYQYIDQKETHEQLILNLGQ